MVGKGPSALVSEKSIELQGKEQTQTSETTPSQQPPTHHVKLNTGESSDVAEWVRHHHSEPGECPEKRMQGRAGTG